VGLIAMFSSGDIETVSKDFPTAHHPYKTQIKCFCSPLLSFVLIVIFGNNATADKLRASIDPEVVYFFALPKVYQLQHSSW
jgi:hypothetical protein